MQFMDKILRAIEFLEQQRDQPDEGMDMAGGPGSAQETPPSRSELDRIESDLDELFAIKAAVEPPHSVMPDKALRQRLWDVQDHWGLHDPAELRP